MALKSSAECHYGRKRVCETLSGFIGQGGRPPVRCSGRMKFMIPFGFINSRNIPFCHTAKESKYIRQRCTEPKFSAGKISVQMPRSRQAVINSNKITINNENVLE